MLHALLVAGAVAVVPQPREVIVLTGAFAWPSRVRLATSEPHVREVVRQVQTYLHAGGITVTVVNGASAADVRIEQGTSPADVRLGDEGYVLRVGSRGVVIRANTPRGAFYALQTLEQITTRSASGLRTQAVAIEDWPAFRWRGMQLDVARHFFPVPVVERFIDAAAHYKLNVFHWHLTDDQAWRLTDARYPALGAGGERYSAADVREVVAYAARRYVTVVPEIDLPAHAGAVLRAYPDIACGPRLLCMQGPGLDFARRVLGDAMAAFPSPYVHAGGDEVGTAAASAQPAFTDAIERYVESRGRRLVGWDEILTPRLSPRAVVMVWTNRARVVQAVRRGNDVVVASAPMYFDAVQGDAAQEPRGSAHMSTLEQVYTDSIVPAGLTPGQAGQILGVQANLWTERITTPAHLFYMAFPRELALAEAAWTPRSRKSWPSFLARLPAQFDWLHAHGYDFRIPNATFALSGAAARYEAVPGAVQTVRAFTAAPALTVALSVPVNDAVIRYTVDGSVPRATSPVYRMPFAVRAGIVPVRLRAVAFVRGRPGAVTECDVERVSAAALHARTKTSSSWAALVSP